MAICFLLSSHGQLMCNFIVPWFWIRVNIISAEIACGSVCVWVGSTVHVFCLFVRLFITIVLLLQLGAALLEASGAPSSVSLVCLFSAHLTWLAGKWKGPIINLWEYMVTLFRFWGFVLKVGTLLNGWVFVSQFQALQRERQQARVLQPVPLSARSVLPPTPRPRQLCQSSCL